MELRRQFHVSLVSLPEAMASSLSGMFDALNAFELLGSFESEAPEIPPFEPQIVALGRAADATASGLTLGAHSTLSEVEATDIVILPSLLIEDGAWVTGRYPAVVDWLSRMHEQGAILCSACSGVLLLAETGLLNGREATVHWAYGRTFRENFPEVSLRLEEVLVVAGDRQEFVMSGASSSWHDLVLYLIAKLVGPAAAQAIAKFLLLQWHNDTQAPYIAFSPPTDHEDAVVREIQEWLDGHFQMSSPVEEMVRLSGLPVRSLKRRFRKATGYAPISYVQHLRVEEAKRLLERTTASTEEIGWQVGYEDPAFFRRLFKRITRLTPAGYRRKFRMPDLPGVVVET